MKKTIIEMHNLTPEKLKEFISSSVSEAFSLYAKQPKQKEVKTHWMTRKEVSELLGVSLVTIHKWSYESKILKPYKIGSRIRFKKSEVEEVLNNSN